MSYRCPSCNRRSFSKLESKDMLLCTNCRSTYTQEELEDRPSRGVIE